MRGAVVALLVLLAGPALATQDAWPALFDVTGVAADDVLNIRAEPNAGAAILDTFAPDRTNIEVIRPNETEDWGMVNTGEGTGWVSLAFLDRQPGQWTYSFPAISACYGNEPFWSIRVTPEVTLSTPEEELSGTETARLSPLNNLTRFGLVADFAGQPFQGVIQRQECSDGMSDRSFGIEINAFYDDQMWSGCCTLGN